MKRILPIAFAMAIVLPGLKAGAQLSPNCERNGKRDYCAITPVAGATNLKQSFDMIMFADNTVYEVSRNLDSCKKVAPNIETCNAKIITPPGNPKPIPAFYRRTFYEGGVKQEYVGKGFTLCTSTLIRSTAIAQAGNGRASALLAVHCTHQVRWST